MHLCLKLKMKPSGYIHLESYVFQEISVMEEELKTKTELIKKHQRLIDGWRKELKEQLEKHVTELETV